MRAGERVGIHHSPAPVPIAHHLNETGQRVTDFGPVGIRNRARNRALCPAGGMGSEGGLPWRRCPGFARGQCAGGPSHIPSRLQLAQAGRMSASTDTSFFGHPPGLTVWSRWGPYWFAAWFVAQTKPGVERQRA